MYDPEMRKDCPMRGNLGNCSPVGGFCMDAVSDEICEAVHNAYDYGFYNAVRTLKEQEEHKTGKWEVKPSNKEQGERDFIWWKCSECGQVIFSESEHDREEFHKYCGRCGAKMT